MSNLEELIERLCPDGVEYKTLGEVATDIYRGAGIKRDQIRKTGTPCVRYGEIYTTYGIFFDSCVSYTDESLLTTKKYFEYGDILFAITGESVEDIAKSCAYVGHEKCLAGGDIVVLKHNEDPKYLSYALATADARRQKSFGKSKNKVVHSSVPAIKSINLTFLTTELAAELAARQKQYEYYRDLLLTFKSNESTILNERTNELELSGAIRWMKLGDICLHSYSGATPKKSNSEYYTNGTIPWIRTQDVVFNSIYKVDAYITEKAVQETGAKWIPENCVIVAISGASAGRCAINKIKATTNQHCLNMEIDSSKALYKYVFYCLCNQEEELILKKQGARGDLNSSIILGMKIPIPPLEQQQRIVDILDRFDTLCNDISSGLPAEIEARQKQYEYYRDKLLTFKELKKEA